MWLFNLLFSSLSQLWYVKVQISRSVSVSPLEFEITRVDSTLYRRQNLLSTEFSINTENFHPWKCQRKGERQNSSQMRGKIEIKEDEGKKQRSIQIYIEPILTIVLLNPHMPCLSKQCRSRSVGFLRSQLIWICTVYHSICELVSTTWIKLSDWLTIRSGHGILFSRQGFTWPPFPHLLQV